MALFVFSVDCSARGCLKIREIAQEHAAALEFWALAELDGLCPVAPPAVFQLFWVVQENILEMSLQHVEASSQTFALFQKFAL